MRMPRWVARIYAFVNGYFWLPCPSCLEPFGGHEWGDVDGHKSTIPKPGDTQPSYLGAGTGICPACTARGVGCRAWAELGLIHGDCGYTGWTRSTFTAPAAGWYYVRTPPGEGDL